MGTAPESPGAGSVANGGKDGCGDGCESVRVTRTESYGPASEPRSRLTSHSFPVPGRWLASRRPPSFFRAFGPCKGGQAPPSGTPPLVRDVRGAFGAAL